MRIRDFEGMYIAELQEARSFEDMLAGALPGMADAVGDAGLSRALEEHLAETRTHLDAVSELLNRHEAPHAHRDGSMSAMIHEAQKMLDMVPNGPLRDAAIIASAQRIEHYEIAVYGTLAAYAGGLGFGDDAEILGAILDQEKAADEALTAIARSFVNPQALETAEV